MSSFGPERCGNPKCGCVSTRMAAYIHGVPYCTCCAKHALERAVLPSEVSAPILSVKLEEDSPS